MNHLELRLSQLGRALAHGRLEHRSVALGELALPALDQIAHQESSKRAERNRNQRVGHGEDHVGPKCGLRDERVGGGEQQA